MAHLTVDPLRSCEAAQQPASRRPSIATLTGRSRAPAALGARDFSGTSSRGGGQPLGGSDDLVGDVGEVVDGPGVQKAQGLLAALLVEETGTGAEHDGVDHEPQFVGQAVLDERSYELEAAGDDDLPVQVLPQVRDLAHHIASEERGVVPAGVLEGGAHDVRGLAVHPVGQRAGPRWPPRGQELECPPTLQQGLGLQMLVEQDLRRPFAVAVADATDPAAKPEALDTGWVLDHSVHRDVLADDDPSHLARPLDRCRLRLMQTPRIRETGRLPTAQFGLRLASVQVAKVWPGRTV